MQKKSLNDVAGAIADWTKIIEETGDPYIFLLRAQAYNELKEFEKAKLDVDYAVEETFTGWQYYRQAKQLQEQLIAVKQSKQEQEQQQEQQ